MFHHVKRFHHFLSKLSLLESRLQINTGVELHCTEEQVLRLWQHRLYRLLSFWLSWLRFLAKAGQRLFQFWTHDKWKAKPPIASNGSLFSSIYFHVSVQKVTVTPQKVFSTHFLCVKHVFNQVFFYSLSKMSYTSFFCCFFMSSHSQINMNIIDIIYSAFTYT